MKKLIKYTLPVAALCALVSCSDDMTSSTSSADGSPFDGKELIALSGNDNGITRAAGFSEDTRVEMCIKAEEIVASDQTAQAPRYAVATATAQKVTNSADLSKLVYISGRERYWDDAFGRKSKLTIYAFAVPGVTADNILPNWSKASWTVVDAKTNPNWSTGSDYTTFNWEVSTQQTATTMTNENLTYSNNISKGGTSGRYSHEYDEEKGWSSKDFEDGQLIWIPKTNNANETTGKFDKGHLVFNHALAWIEINLKEGEGFNNSANTDFTWTKNQDAATQNITLVGFNTSGTFDVATGTWSDLHSANITEMDEKTGTPTVKTTRQLYAYVLPGTNLYGTTTNVVEFEIDNAKYYISGQKIAEAIRSYYTTGAGKNDAKAASYQNFTTIEAGKHYVINLSVSKKSVDRITAAIIDWESVNSEDAVAENTYPEFTLDNRGTKLTVSDKNQFALYRAAQTAPDYITGQTDANYEWKTGYGEAATKSYDATNSLWATTDWFWENNLTYYHFRAAGYTESSSEAGVTITTDATNGDYFAITSGALSGSAYKDYVWGAPFNTEAADKVTYSTSTGFDNETSSQHQISQAISTTASTINMLLFHMTSQITVNIRTTTDASKVTLKDDSQAAGQQLTKVEILNFLPDGRVLMGNGLVSTTSTARTPSAAMTNGTYHPAANSDPDRVNGYTYGIVPQPLTWTGGTIGLRITTPDGNQYVVKDLSTCTATVTSNNIANPYTAASDSSNYTIGAWYPGFKYNYTITIQKTGVERITAAVVGWEEVIGDLGTINLED